MESRYICFAREVCKGVVVEAQFVGSHGCTDDRYGILWVMADHVACVLWAPLRYGTGPYVVLGVSIGSHWTRFSLPMTKQWNECG